MSSAPSTPSTATHAPTLDATSSVVASLFPLLAVVATLAVAVAVALVVVVVVAGPSSSAVAAGSQSTTTAGGASVVGAGEVEAAPEDSGPFTLGQLHDGEVSPTRFAAFWDAALERIRTAPCPGPVAAGTTVVVATVGATPPAHLGDAYTDYAPLIAEARAEAAAACG